LGRIAPDEWASAKAADINVVHLQRTAPNTNTSYCGWDFPESSVSALETLCLLAGLDCGELPDFKPALPLSPLDRLIISFDQGLKTLFARTPGQTFESNGGDAQALSPEAAQRSGALMRVNHVGEVCAQALYQSQSLFSRSAEQRAHFEQAAEDERAHLAWTRQRIEELGTHASYLNPLWYAGAFTIGAVAGLAGDKISLGFVVETERQVEQHLASHLDRLPAEDTTSRRIVERMKIDEARHAAEAEAAGALPLPRPLPQLMRLAARIMTRTAHHI